jgi:hypothetical protein
VTRTNLLLPPGRKAPIYMHVTPISICSYTAAAKNENLAVPTVAVLSPPSCTQVVCAMNTLWLRLLSLFSWCCPITRLVSPCNSITRFRWRSA